MAKSETQASRLVSVDGHKCELNIGAIPTYFKGDVLCFHWRDPEPDEGDGIRLNRSRHQLGEYYGPITEIIREAGPDADGYLSQLKGLTSRLVYIPKYVPTSHR